MERNIKMQTGKGGAILFANRLRELGGLPPMSAEQEDEYRDGAYSISAEDWGRYLGYPTDMEDCLYVSKEGGRLYLDEIRNKWAHQVQEITEDEMKFYQNGG